MVIKARSDDAGTSLTLPTVQGNPGQALDFFDLLHPFFKALYLFVDPSYKHFILTVGPVPVYSAIRGVHPLSRPTTHYPQSWRGIRSRTMSSHGIPPL